jgi:hypothetical protein
VLNWIADLEHTTVTGWGIHLQQVYHLIAAVLHIFIMNYKLEDG